MYASVRGTRLFFDIDGSGWRAEDDCLAPAPVLFLLHGGPGGDHSSFKTTVRQLRSHAQLVYVDHRGSGRSEACDPATYTLENNIDDLEALRIHLGLDQISVLGSSYGGIVAQGYALQYPDRTANLILCATAHSYRFLEQAQQIVAERGTADQQRVCQWLWDGQFESAEQLKEYYEVMGPLYSLRFDRERFLRSWDRGIRNFQQLNLGFTTFLKTFDFLPRLHEIPCPTLVLAGAHDWICPPDHSREIAQRIPRAHLKIFRHSSHALAADEPEAFLNAVRGFLTYADS